MGKKHKRKHKAAGSDRPPRLERTPDMASAFVATDPASAIFVATDPASAIFVATDPGSAAFVATDPTAASAAPPSNPDDAPVAPPHEQPHDVMPGLDRRLVAGCDVDADNAADVAPVGPTEPGLSSGFGQDPEDPQAAQRFGIEPSTASTASTPETSTDDIQQQIRDLEARLDQMFGKTREGSDKPPAPVPADKPSTPNLNNWGSGSPAAPFTPNANLNNWGSGSPAAPFAPNANLNNWGSGSPTAPFAPNPTPVPQRPSVVGQATADEVLSPEFCARQWGREGLRSRSEEVDEFGLDPMFERRLLPTLDFLHSRYFRVAVEGAEHIPARGRCLIVANHSGGPLPYDGAMLRTAVRREHSAHRELRWLAEDFVYYLPFVGTFMNRIGAVRACQENAERLLGKGELVAVFPEGAKGIGKLFRDRYKLQRFGRGGFIRLCLRTRTPIVPCAIVGAEEANPMLYRIEYMTKALGIPYFPITPTFPALGAFGLLPAPTKWKIRFGEPLTWSGYGTEAADDDILVGRLSERVRASIQTMLDRMLSERRSIWFG